MYMDELKHHGIKGQKWGVRHGPPYPLKDSQKSSSEIKRGSVAKKKPSSHEQTVASGKAFVDSQLQGDAVSLAVSAATYVAVLAFVYHREKKRAKKAEEQYQERRATEKEARKNVNSLDDIPKKTEESTPEEDMKAVNPNFNGRQTEGYNMNCMYCSTVYDLRRRGYDVTAHSRTAGGKTDEILDYYKGAKVERIMSNNAAKNRSDLYKALESLPEGSRGNLCMSGSIFGGHSIAWEVRGGKPTLIDAQLGREWGFEEITSRYTGFEYVRTDNCEINAKAIGEVISPDSLKRRAS